MYTVLLVEDVDLVRDDIVGMIDWEAQGFTIVAQARNGAQGLRLFRQFQPDVIITDIKMPVMSGLEMIREIVRTEAGTQFIVLTAYEEFDYAKQAIQLGVNSFVMKYEIDSEILLKELAKAKESLRTNEELDFYSIGQLIKGLINGEEHNQALQERLRFPQILLLASPYVPDNRLLFLDSNEYWSEASLQLEERQSVSAVVMSPGECVMLLSAQGITSELRRKEYWRQFAGQLVGSAPESQKLHVAYGGYCAGPNQIRAAYANARSAMKNRVFCSAPSILEELPLDATSQQIEEADQRIAALRRKLEAGHYVEAAAAASRVLMDFLRRQRSYPLYLHTIKEMEVAMNMRFSDDCGVETVHALVLDRINTMARDAKIRYSKKVREMIGAIHEKYHTDLNLNQLSEALQLNPVYAGQLFKKETGKSFTTYLTEYRMERAQELLRAGELKIYEISERVGYQSVQYFSKTFKKVTGKKPSQR